MKQIVIERTITISDEVYKELLKVMGNKSLSEVLGKLVKKEGNLGILQIGFGSRDKKETEMLKRELREIEEGLQRWI
ncbi:MAG: antitoxin VapB family protein [archaeon]|nr:antitoxin VapB family protein [archaeon]